MNEFFWLVVPLVALGLLALSPRLWFWFRGRRTTHSLWPRGSLKSATLFYFGLGSLALAAIDAGLAAWQMEYHFGDDDRSEVRTGLFPPGAEAPDFSLPSVDEGRSVRLSDFRGHKPVVLIFGSFS